MTWLYRVFTSVFIYFAISLGVILLLVLWVIPGGFFATTETGIVAGENVEVVNQVTHLATPVRLRIDKINVDSVIESVGLTRDGKMDTPKEAARAGWFSNGPSPGEIGSAVIAGHLDGNGVESGVFQQLYLLTGGDEITIVDDNNVLRTFVVLESRVYNWDEDVPNVFYRKDGRFLNLITCSGTWVSTEEKFGQRLVVFSALKSQLDK